MDSFDVTVEHGVFRVSERRQSGGALSYDLLWVNGPSGGTYGFTVGRSILGTGGITSDDAARMTREELVAEVRGFVEHVYEPGGIGETWPDHIRARDRQ
ncbi:hypothetical protein [Arthrobacter sp. NPDC092385]|uniref:hypothetical protein n=1 Tax=Arthrobacter sp. NPDC092385 TaxID=3363943 RepID=UPI00382AC648